MPMLSRAVVPQYAWLFLVLGSPAAADMLTHGPLVGHTTHESTRIWIRAERQREFQVRMAPAEGRGVVLSGKISLNQEDNFCGVAVVDGLAAETVYEYEVILDGEVQSPSVRQQVRTFPPPGKKGTVRIGLGHSLIGPGEQTSWRAVAGKKPDLFILMGDNIYSDSTEPKKQRRMYLEFRADPHFREFAATTPIYAIWDDHDFGKNNSDGTQEGKRRSLSTFNEIWPNPPSQAGKSLGIWTRFSVGRAEFFLLDVRYHRSPNQQADGPEKTMLGRQQRDWLVKSLIESRAVFKFPVSGSSWQCGGQEAWNHQFLYEYDSILAQLEAKRVAGIILLGGDQHYCKIGVRPKESWGGYDLHEWMAGQLWNREADVEARGFGIITIDTALPVPEARLQFFDHRGEPRNGKRIPYTTPGSLRALWDSPPGTTVPPVRAADGELRRNTGPIWDALPDVSAETLSERDLYFKKGSELFTQTVSE